MEVLQYWEENETQLLGIIQLDENVAMLGEFSLEVQIENKANGTIGLKIRNANSGRDVRFSFVRNQSQSQYNYLEQKSLVDNVFLNNIIY